MRIGVACGHSRDTTGERRFEFNCCAPVSDLVARLLKTAGYGVVEPGAAIYDADNDAALNAKIALFNREAVDLAVEIHLNAGGGDYSTVLYWDDTGTGKYSFKGQQAAGAIADEFRAFSWRSSGARPQSYFNRSLAFLNQLNAPAIITECGFKDNIHQRAFLESESGQAQHAGRIYLGIERYIHRGRTS